MITIVKHNRVDALHRVYNETQADLIQVEISAKLLGRMALMQPDSKPVIEKKKEVDEMVKVKADALAIIVEMLIEEEKKSMKEPKDLGEKENVKKD